jgi:hypothetical protein
MTQALRDYEEQAGEEAFEQVETDDRRCAARVGARQPTATRPTAEVGMPAAEAELLGEYNLYNG